jgi:hypothetical protein
MSAQIIRLADRRRGRRTIEDEIASFISDPPQSAFSRGTLYGLLVAHDLLRGRDTFRGTRLQILQEELEEAAE